TLELDARRHHQLHRFVDRQATLADQPSADASFFEDFTRGSRVRHLVVLDVAARRQPLAQLAVVVQQHATLMNDEDSNGEVAQRLARRDRRVLRHLAFEAILRAWTMRSWCGPTAGPAE